jgi:hypothetical protein
MRIILMIFLVIVSVLIMKILNTNELMAENNPFYYYGGLVFQCFILLIVAFMSFRSNRDV